MTAVASRRFPELLTAVVMISIALCSACSPIRTLIGQQKIQPPEVDVVGAKLTGLSFEKADLVFDLRIRNPNPLGLKLSAFDYDLALNGASFLQGEQKRELQIASQGESNVQLPLSVGFAELYRVFQSLRHEDMATYQLNCNFLFDVPVLGPIQIPAAAQGDVPLPKLPAVSLQALELKRLDLSGAQLGLEVRLSNPNAFSLMVQEIQYQLNIDGHPWVSAETSHIMHITEQGDGLVEIPIFLDFVQIGTSAYQLLTGDRPLDYQFHGNIDVTTPIPLLDQAKVSFDRSGQIQVLK